MNKRLGILGQGLAGTLLSYQLLQAGKEILVFDPHHEDSSSMVAAGIINPVTGRHFVLVPHFEEYISSFSVYRQLEQLLEVTLLHKLTIYRDLSSVETRNHWDLRRSQPAYQPYMLTPIQAARANVPFVNSQQWVGPTVGAFRLDIRALLLAWRDYLRKESRLREVRVGEEELIHWQKAGSGSPICGETIDQLIDCRGAASAKTQVWSALPWRLSKGEAITYALKDWPRDRATKLGGHFLCPYGDGETVWYGGTSQDSFDSIAPTPAALENFLAEFDDRGLEFPNHFHHVSAVRPTTRDRRVLLEESSLGSKFFLCNGLGTKGALVAPSVTKRCSAMILAQLDG